MHTRNIERFKLLLIYNTLKYLKFVQIFGRIFSILKKKIYSKYIPLSSVPKYSKLNNKTSYLYFDYWNSYQEILDGEFNFLNKKVKLNFPPDWVCKQETLLWRFNLHYLNYIFLLPPCEKVNIVVDWITKNPYGKEPAWHPYVISLRIISLLKENWSDDRIIESIARQTDFLYHNLEYYHPANHYLENGRALIFAGLFFDGSEEGKKWLEKGMQIYYDQLPLQLLEDGCYFEKSPMYHNLILIGLMDILNIIKEGTVFYLFIKKYAEKMLSFACSFSFSNGNFPLLNDSTINSTPSNSSLVNYYQRITKTDAPISVDAMTLTKSGYFIYKKNSIELIADYGSIGPNFIPAHSHADIFTFELYYQGLPFVVDTGVYEYQSGEMRNYCRSTKAHNTISIDGKDQAEMWGGFRVGKRYDPENISLTDTGSRKIISGEFKGWGKLIGDGLSHRRQIDCCEKSIEVIDEVVGSGEHIIENFIHFHPDVEVRNEEGGLTLSNENIKIKLEINSDFKMKNCYYFPEFGRIIERKMIFINSVKIPFTSAYSFFFIK